MNHLKTRTIMIGEQAIRFYEHRGENQLLPTLVFLHGWRSSSQVWKPVLDNFIQKGFSIYLLDLPGFGESENPKTPFSVKEYAFVLKSFMERMDVNDSVLIGHSFGGRVAIKLAALEPQVCEKLILVDAAGVRVDSSTSWKRVVAKIVSPFFTPSFMQPLRRRIYTLMGAEDYVATPELKETFTKVINEDLTPLLPHLKCPTLLVWGEQDDVTPLEEARVMERLIKNSRLHIYKNAGHYSFLENPKKFSKDVISFIDNNLTTSGS